MCKGQTVTIPVSPGEVKIAGQVCEGECVFFACVLIESDEFRTSCMYIWSLP